MTPLASVNAMAREAGMSYGKFVLAHPEFAQQPKRRVHTGEKPCAICGKPYRPRGVHSRYCSKTCRERAEKHLRRLRNAREKGAKLL